MRIGVRNGWASGGANARVSQGIRERAPIRRVSLRASQVRPQPLVPEAFRRSLDHLPEEILTLQNLARGLTTHFRANPISADANVGGESPNLDRWFGGILRRLKTCIPYLMGIQSRDSADSVVRIGVLLSILRTLSPFLYRDEIRLPLARILWEDCKDILQSFEILNLQGSNVYQDADLVEKALRVQTTQEEVVLESVG